MGCVDIVSLGKELFQPRARSYMAKWRLKDRVCSRLPFPQGIKDYGLETECCLTETFIQEKKIRETF